MINKINTCNKCKDCYYWNRHDLTYVSKEMDCCAYWHIAYHPEHDEGENIKDCFTSKIIQLTFFLDYGFEYGALEISINDTMISITYTFDIPF